MVAFVAKLCSFDCCWSWPIWRKLPNPSFICQRKTTTRLFYHDFLFDHSRICLPYALGSNCCSGVRWCSLRNHFHELNSQQGPTGLSILICNSHRSDGWHEFSSFNRHKPSPFAPIPDRTCRLPASFWSHRGAPSTDSLRAILNVPAPVHQRHHRQFHLAYLA